MRSELGNRMLSQGTNALASSIVLACRPRPESAPRTDRRGFLAALIAIFAIGLALDLQGAVCPSPSADPQAFLQAGAGFDEAAIQAQIAARAAAKAGKDFAEADRIRNALLAQGIVLKDSAAGTTWEAAQ